MYSPLESLKIPSLDSKSDGTYLEALDKFNTHAQTLPGVFASIAQNCIDAQRFGLYDDVAVGKMALLLRGHRRLFQAHKKPKSLKGFRERSESKKSLHRLLLQYEVDRDGIKVFDIWLKEYEKNARAVWLAEAAE